jgi:hypothetical protein
MAGLDPAIHVLSPKTAKRDVDARHKAGHDELNNHTLPPEQPIHQPDVEAISLSAAHPVVNLD